MASSSHSQRNILVRHRRSFIGGSDARIIMGDNEADLLQLWKEKRGEIEPQDLSDDLLVQLGSATEPLVAAFLLRRRRVFPLAVMIAGIAAG